MFSLFVFHRTEQALLRNIVTVTMLALLTLASQVIAQPAEPDTAQPEPAAAAPAGTNDGLQADPAAAAAVAVEEPSEMDVAATSFQKFCAEWLEKLVEREQQSLSKIEWVTSETGVRGTYIGYSRNGRCETKRGTDAIPVGKLTYRQVTYEKKGIDVAAAEMSAARPLNVDEVIEIFHYSDGKWIY